MIFQVQYKINSKTYTINLPSFRGDLLRDFVSTIINGEITEIREFIHEDSTIKKDDKDYIHSKTLTLKNDLSLQSVRIPKIKKSLDDNELQNLISNPLLVQKTSINSVKIATKF